MPSLAGWLPVLRGEDVRTASQSWWSTRTPQRCATVAVFDAVINNSDRKGSHLVREGGALRGFDHGVSLHEDDKLRTVAVGLRRAADRPTTTWSASNAVARPW